MNPELQRSTDLSEAAIRDLLQRGTFPVKGEPSIVAEQTGMTGPFRKAAVLMPLAKIKGEWHLVYTRRTETVQDHKGQVAFPGGAWEPVDNSLEETALREANEEIGLLPSDVRILGNLDQMLTITSFLVTPVVGVIRWPFPFILSQAEVSRVFTIPLAWLADPANAEERPFFHPQRNATLLVIYYQPYDGEILWGASARMTRILLKVLKLIE